MPFDSNGVTLPEGFDDTDGCETVSAGSKNFTPWSDDRLALLLLEIDLGG